MSRRRRATLLGEARATSSVWSDVVPACGACHACDAWPQRRQRGDLDPPARRQKHWVQQPRREARTGQRRWSRWPRSEAHHGQQRRPGSQSGGGWRPRGREEPRRSSSTDKPVGPRWLSRMEPRERPPAALGKRERERDRSRRRATD